MKKIFFSAIAMLASATMHAQVDEITFNYELIDFSAAPRTTISPMSIKLWDSYANGGPTNYGTVIEIFGRNYHQTTQLNFGGWDNSKIRYREAFYNDTAWSNWITLLDSKNDVESAGNLKILGTGSHFIQNGNVGIGTSTPSHKLAVNGTVRAKEVIVDTGWSDFVFEDGYNLRSLKEVENHIAQNGHLPDVPSAASISSDGLSVGEAQKLMMQKIEELTLYVIAQQKEIDAQREEIEALKSN